MYMCEYAGNPLRWGKYTYINIHLTVCIYDIIAVLVSSRNN
jgi:hypothetical protein